MVALPNSLKVTSIHRISTDSLGNESNGDSFHPFFSPDGTKLLFMSNADNLIENDTNASGDLFIKDLTTGEVTKVSTDSEGNQLYGHFTEPVFSPDGTKIAFVSEANTLVESDTNSRWDVFVKDLLTGAVTRVSTDALGNEATGHSGTPVFTPDGNHIIFSTENDGLTPDDTNANSSIFMKNLTTGEITLISADENGVQQDAMHDEPTVSPDGTKVAMVIGGHVYVKDLTSGTLTLAETDAEGNPGNAFSNLPVFAPYGNTIAFVSSSTNLTGSDDINGFVKDVFIKNLDTGEVTAVMTSELGLQGNGDAFYYDSSSTIGRPAFSPDGIHIAFVTYSSDLVDGDTNNAPDLFIKNLYNGNIIRVTLDMLGNETSGDVYDPVFSPDGTKIALVSNASSLVAGDTNGVHDIFVLTLEPVWDNGSIEGTSEADLLIGTDEGDDIIAFEGNDTIHAGLGNDTVFAGSGNDTIRGDVGDDELYAEDGDDTVSGGDGDDIIAGGSGNDDLRGVVGNDVIYGDEGIDTISGGIGNDTIYGGADNDDLRGADGDDVVYGDDGDDQITGAEGNDFLSGGNGVDFLSGGIGNDTLHGGDGNDDLRGVDGDDKMYGESGNDFLVGGLGADSIDGGEGNDDLRGADGNDELRGGAGVDTLIGGLDADSFVFDSATLGSNDSVRDFSQAQGDKLVLDTILIGFTAGVSDIDDFVKLATSATGMTLRVDLDGAGGAHNFQNIAFIKGASGLVVQDMYDGGSLVVL